jgi:NAD(P)H-hydrate epimerase
MLLRIKKTDRILSVCGPGNNGGDGVAAARLLNQKGYAVAIAFLGEEEKCSAQMKAQLMKAKELNIPFENCNKLPEYNVIIDAIFGIGLTREVNGPYAAAIRLINEGNHLVFAVDIPSGINADNGRVMNVAVRADETVPLAIASTGSCCIRGRNMQETSSYLILDFRRKQRYRLNRIHFIMMRGIYEGYLQEKSIVIREPMAKF